MFLFSNHSFIEIRKSLLVAIARMEVKNSKQSIIKINLNGFKVRVKALIHDAIFRPGLFCFDCEYSAQEVWGLGFRNVPESSSGTICICERAR